MGYDCRLTISPAFDLYSGSAPNEFFDAVLENAHVAVEHLLRRCFSHYKTRRKLSRTGCGRLLH